MDQVLPPFSTPPPLHHPHGVVVMVLGVVLGVVVLGVVVVGVVLTLSMWM